MVFGASWFWTTPSTQNKSGSSSTAQLPGCRRAAGLAGERQSHCKLPARSYTTIGDKITANELAQYMVGSETGKIGAFSRFDGVAWNGRLRRGGDIGRPEDDGRVSTLI